MNKVLVVDDDKNICEILKIFLEKDGLKVYTANDGETALKMFNEVKPTIALLDIMMPGMDGIELCKEIRKIDNTPIMFISAKDQTMDKILGLELGADDYIVKPFDASEVVARVKAILRRIVTKDKAVEYEDLSIDINSFTVVYKGEKYELPPKELELFYFLAKNPNRVYTREQLLDNVWGIDFFGDSRTVDVHIKRLREKFVHDKWGIKTVWGVGYKFEVNLGELNILMLKCF